ncbi:PHP domain-containing protein [Clostridium sp.]|uniref:PHP domain-containing protein n=1 Tax=Clostridium sp. TaxID=1506 RepID=UPI003217A7BB
MNDKNYTTYHLHTENSLLDSCTNFKLYVDRAVELGQTALAFTEHGNLYNWIEKKMYCNEKGLKYIHGVECYLTHSLEEKVRDNYHTILLAKNHEGVKEINKLIDLSTRPDHVYYKPRLTFEEFFNISNNVIKISACLASPLNKFLNYNKESLKSKVNDLKMQEDSKIKEIMSKSNDKKLEEIWINSYDDADYDKGTPWAWRCTPHEAYLEKINVEAEEVKEKYNKLIKEVENFDKYKNVYNKLLQTYDYYEIQPHICLEQIEYNKLLFQASKQFNKPLIVGTDTHSIDQYKAECRSILQKAKGISYTDEDVFDLTYKSYSELIEMFKSQNSLSMDIIEEALENTNRMANTVEDFKLDTSFKYPKLYDDEEHVLKQRIIKKLKEKIAAGVIDKEKEREYNKNIVEEFKVFKKINMVGFILFMSELVCWCWENDIPIGFCRGSVGGSTIAYITDIIDVDPVIWKTVFSRFANEDRLEIGDIDIDISPSQRHLVYKHIIEQFGQDNTAYILAIGTISDKGSIDEIGRALSRKWDDYKNYMMSGDNNQKYEMFEIFIRLEDKQQNNRLDELKNDFLGNPYSLDVISRIKKEYEADPGHTKEKYPDIFYYFDGLNGTAISQSMHPAGIIVSPVTLSDNYSTFWVDDKRILSINMEECHEISLVKYDLLGLKNIEIIHKCCQYAGIPYPKSHEINWIDKKVWDDITKSPVGIFQFEGDYAFSLLEGFKPICVNDLSLCNASLRPSGASYRDRLLAREVNQNPSKLIDDLLADNNGFLVFQEDTIKFLKDICGLSGSDADNVRRAIGRKQLDRLQKALPQILEGYCNMSSQPREVAEEEAKEFLQIIEDSSNYQFGYNHSTGYSMIGYTCAYMRYYYPEEFIAAYLNCANNSDDIKNGTILAKQLGIKINNIKFGHSRADYTVDKKNHALYKGIESIKFCNAIIANELYELSKNKYDSFPELLKDIKEKTSINSRQLTILTGLNFFSDYGKNQYLLSVINIYDKFSTCKQIKKEKMESLGITEYLMKKYAGKETPKQYSQIDNIGLIKELTSRLEDKSMSVIEQIKFEMNFLEYCVYTNPKVNEQYYVVIEYKHYKDASKPYLTLHNIKTGEDIKSRIKQGKIFKLNPFGLYSILKVKKFAMYNKTKCIGGEWVKTNDLEPILESYEVIQ